MHTNQVHITRHQADMSEKGPSLISSVIVLSERDEFQAQKFCVGSR